MTETEATSAELLCERLLRELTSNSAEMDEELWAEDVVVEVPFAPAGRPRRFEGRAAFLKLAREGRRALPVRFDGARNVVVHRTSDPAVIVAEYELFGTLTATEQTASASFIGVLTARNGQVAHWREYQNTAALSQVFSSQP